MDINEILKPIDNLLVSLNNNKPVLLLVLLLLGIYTMNYNEYITERAMNLFSNNTFKIIIFVLVTYIGSSSPAIGISLAIIVLVSLQIITNLKIKKEINNERFSQMQPVDMSYLNDEYLTNPLKMQNELSPPVNFNLKLTTPNELYVQMLKKGKMLLDDSYELDRDLENRYDIREQGIANITRRNGTELVDSGMNRLQKADQGEYNILNSNQKQSKFIKYNRLLEENKNNPIVLAIYNELLYNYDILVSKQLDQKSFNSQLDKVYLNEFELLETIYKNKKLTLSEDKKQQIETEINKIKQLKVDNKDWFAHLSNLTAIIE